MAVANQIKLLDRKIMRNEAQYHLDRKATKISTLSSNNLNKYEYLTGKDLDLKSSTVEQAQFEYSPLGKIFNNRLDKDEDKKEGLLKRLKNIEDKNEELLKAKNKIENTKEVTDYADAKDANFRKLEIKSGNNVDYDFSDYKTFKELFRDLYYRKITIDDAERKQDEFDVVLYRLNKYTPKNPKYIEAKNNLVKNVEKFYGGRKRKYLIRKYFRFFAMKYWRKKLDSRKKKKILEMKTVFLITKNLQDWLISKSETNDELIRKHFLVQDLGELLEKLRRSKNNPGKNNIQVNFINSGLRDLKEENEDLNEQEKESENSNEIVDLVENILEFNRQQQGQGLKILTPGQRLSRLPISLAQ